MLHVYRLQVPGCRCPRNTITRTEKLLQQCTIILTLEKKTLNLKTCYEIGCIVKRGEEAEAEEKLPCSYY